MLKFFLVKKERISPATCFGSFLTPSPPTNVFLTICKKKAPNIGFERLMVKVRERETQSLNLWFNGAFDERPKTRNWNNEQTQRRVIASQRVTTTSLRHQQQRTRVLFPPLMNLNRRWRNSTERLHNHGGDRGDSVDSVSFRDKVTSPPFDYYISWSHPWTRQRRRKQLRRHCRERESLMAFYTIMCVSFNEFIQNRVALIFFLILI